MSTLSTAPVEVELPDLDEATDTDRPWVVVVLNDPVHLMVYVV